MSKYYCRECAKAMGALPTESTASENLTGNKYKLEKFVKHNYPTKIEKIHSIFADPSMSKYSEYVVNTSASGCLEIDDKGRMNLIFAAGEVTGYTFVNGTLYRPDNAIRLVFYQDQENIHAFSTSGSVIPQVCSKCGKQIIF